MEPPRGQRITLRGPPPRCAIDPTPGHDLSLPFDGPPEALRQLCGELDKHLRIVSRALGVRASQRGAEIRIQGDDGSVELAAEVLRQLYHLVLHGFALYPSDVDQACRLIRHDPQAPIRELFTDTVWVAGKGRNVFPRTPAQRHYIQAIRDHDVVFGIGPAGTGKTYLAMAMAAAALKRGEVARIVLCRPAVEAGEKLGFLPGALEEKVNPYLRPLYDALNDLVTVERAQKMVLKGIVEVAPLAFMRGRTLSSSFVILDEAQNTTSEQMKMFLTRFGVDTKVVVTGDITQIDLPKGQVSGLVEAVDILSDVPGIEVAWFTDRDVVRHPLVAEIIRAYDRARTRRRPEAAEPTPSADPPDAQQRPQS